IARGKVGAADSGVLNVAKDADARPVRQGMGAGDVEADEVAQDAQVARTRTPRDDAVAAIAAEEVARADVGAAEQERLRAVVNVDAGAGVGDHQAAADVGADKVALHDTIADAVEGKAVAAVSRDQVDRKST